MSARSLRRVLALYLVLLAPVAWLSTFYVRYMVDGDGVAYMDIADLLYAHRWADAVNGYWHPLYPAILWLAQVMARPTRALELAAYREANLFVFAAQVVAMLAFVSALVRLRERMAVPAHHPAHSLLGVNTLRLLGVGLMVVSMTRELPLARISPDAVLETFLLAAIAMLMYALATGRLIFAPLMGVFFGLAYLAKSFAMVMGLLTIVMLVGFGWWVRKWPVTKALAGGALALVAFGCVAGPYVSALSHQKGRFDFGDSGNLNYVWYVSETEKMHLEPWMTKDFGAATVKLTHPEKQLLPAQGPQGMGVYSYAEHALGSYPPWFDTTWFNERITPRFDVRRLMKRDARNFVLVWRYLLNHPEPLLLLALLLLCGAKLRAGLRASWFWLPAFGLGVIVWVLYGMVNVEERYVTVAYLMMVLAVFAALDAVETKKGILGAIDGDAMRRVAAGMVVLLAFGALIEVAREAAQQRRDESVEGLPHGWYNPQIYGAADGLPKLGVMPGDQIACMGTTACLYDNYWVRLAGVQVIDEVYAPEKNHLVEQWDAVPNRGEIVDTLRAQGARVLVASFEPGAMSPAHASTAGWVRLGETNFYALPLHLSGSSQPAPQ